MCMKHGINLTHLILQLAKKAICVCHTYPRISKESNKKLDPVPVNTIGK